jgi:hypothetical protein
MTDKESLKLALEKIARVNAMDYEYQSWAREALTKQALALNKKAENARELGLDYEPAPVQEPEHIVHSNGRYSPLLTRMMNKQVESNAKPN